MRPWPAALLASAIVASTTIARADPPRQTVRFDPDFDIPLTVFGATALVVTEVAKPSLAPAACRWCDASLDGLDRAVRDALLWKSPQTANTLSNVAVFGLAPVSALGLTALAAWHDRKQENIPADSVLILEAMFMAMDLDQTTKYIAGRARPFVRFHNDAVLKSSPDPNDDNLSFFSGHTTAAFSLAVSSGTLASMRGYRWAPWVWTQGLALAVASGYLRIAADRHYMTDVLTGALVGAAAGVAVPLLHRPRRVGTAVFTIGPVAGPGIGISGLW